MITVFIPVNKSKEDKPGIRGFWRNDSGKIYYDYIRVRHTSYIEPKHLEQLKKLYNQEAIAYRDNATNCLHIYYNKNKTDVLTKRILIEVGFNRDILKGLIKKYLRDYSGCTIYKNDYGYNIEVFY